MQQSTGHIAFVGEFEFFAVGGEMYRAPISACIMTDGRRCGRWECSLDRAKRYPSLYPFVK